LTGYLININRLSVHNEGIQYVKLVVHWILDSREKLDGNFINCHNASSDKLLRDGPGQSLTGKGECFRNKSRGVENINLHFGKYYVKC
jgi:hypothetical protein